MAVDRRLAECLFKLKQYPEFEPFREWLVTESDKAMKTLIASNDDRQLAQAQGAARQLKVLQDLVDDSERLLGR